MIYTITGITTGLIGSYLIAKICGASFEDTGDELSNGKKVVAIGTSIGMIIGFAIDHGQLVYGNK
ncbi:hypothetical protein QJ850_gp105 [Acanthamoeba polyphaga mimivirus]|uniref:Uncharacterized protein n=1 Tax=Acanthamoeba polyphaga mimivirus Kroon TaxID=3069720 RepID=A0A0G2Y7R6_9VIRU|nr:hypothetical protein QJ850_gp105 [Acanthamoeba polyphaga mimivirus]AKI80594.1 hypothetical protein [Acanthamoeba polyphaga mimivirus Kroon]